MRRGPEFRLETERLRLRPYTLDDLDDLFGILGDQETMTYYPEPYSRDRTMGWIEDNVKRYEMDGFGLWAMEMKETGDFVGDCGPAVREVERQREIAGTCIEPCGIEASRPKRLRRGGITASVLSG